MIDFVKFTKNVMKLPLWVRIWMGILILFNFIIPLFLLGRTEARVVIATFVVAALLMMMIARVAGFTRLIGLSHFVWIPLLIYLWTRIGGLPADEFYGLWVRLVMLLNAASLVMDAVDVGRYLLGDRAEMVLGP